MGEDMYNEIARLRSALDAATKRAEEAEQELAMVKTAYQSACSMVALMHAAAIGEVAGPTVGVVEDIAALRSERDVLAAKLAESRKTIYFTWTDVENCREALSIDAGIKGDTLSDVFRSLLNERVTLEARLAEDNAVCLCGCPLSEHEDNGEDGEQCENEDHVCLRTCPAISQTYVAARDRLADAVGSMCPSCLCRLNLATLPPPAEEVKL